MSICLSLCDRQLFVVRGQSWKYLIETSEVVMGCAERCAESLVRRIYQYKIILSCSLDVFIENITEYKYYFLVYLRNFILKFWKSIWFNSFLLFLETSF